MNHLPFQGKRILVTAGPTWTPVDKVRVMTSVFSGETGLFIARYFRHLGAEVTLLMGPGRARFCKEDWTEMNIIQFFYYEELKDLLFHEAEKNYDVIFHSCAVSDFTPAEVHDGKISSAEGFFISMTPTEKLVDRLKTISPKTLLVKFKLQVGISPPELHEIALNSLKTSNAQLIVANLLEDVGLKKHRTWVLNAQGNAVESDTKESLCNNLSQMIMGFPELKS